MLAASSVCDFGTVVALGSDLRPFTYRTLVFAIATAIVIGVLPWVTPRFFRAFGGRPSDSKRSICCWYLFALGGLAAWPTARPSCRVHSGMVLAGTVGKGSRVQPTAAHAHVWLPHAVLLHSSGFVRSPCRPRRCPGIVAGLFFAKVVRKKLSVWPVTRFFRFPRTRGAYATLLMSTGLTLAASPRCSA